MICCCLCEAKVGHGKLFMDKCSRCRQTCWYCRECWIKDVISMEITETVMGEGDGVKGKTKQQVMATTRKYLRQC